MQRKQNVVVMPPENIETKLHQENKRILKSILNVKSQLVIKEQEKYADHSRFTSPNAI
jgi:hypothetical protein